MLTIILSGCCVQQPEFVYKKITSDEAVAMMTSDVVILDVRTQEEFDGGHIKNAVLLPDYEISEKAESVLADRNQTILIYCRTGRRSELAAKELVGMGYTSVYDFGGIVDWTGEIVQSTEVKITPIDVTENREGGEDNK